MCMISIYVLHCLLIVILGGFGLGNAVGLLAHYGRTLSGDPPPKVNLEVVTPVSQES
jgi:hypothetical protein